MAMSKKMERLFNAYEKDYAKVNALLEKVHARYSTIRNICANGTVVEATACVTKEAVKKSKKNAKSKR